MGRVAENIRTVEASIAEACRLAGRAPGEVTLIAVTKTRPVAAILEAYSVGLRHFGENRVQEAVGKLPELRLAAPEAVWHMIGHLQSNKAKAAADLFDTIDSVDTVHLAERLKALSSRRVPVLLEVNVSGEAAKSGFSPEALAGSLERISAMPNLDVRGLMTVAPLAADAEAVRPVFRRLRELRDRLGLRELSMGMSDDYAVAIQEGSTMVRIGRAIFGER